VDIVLALTALFNFTRLRDGDIVDDYIYHIEGDFEDIQPTTEPTTTNRVEANSNKSMDVLRDKIAEEMWKDYQQYINKE
jgi:hypothetical protein